MNQGLKSIAVGWLLIGAWMAAAQAKPLLVLSCNVPPQQGAMQQIGAEITAARPDIVLLQGVRGWAACSALVKTLKPDDYYILTCSSFGAPAEGQGSREVAVLSRHKGYNARIERSGTNWPAVGFAFVAITAEDQRIGVVSAEFGRTTQAVHSAESIIKHIELVKGWRVNRPSSFLVMGPPLTGPAKTSDVIREMFSTNDLALATGAPARALAYAQPSGSAKFVEVVSTNTSILRVSLDPAFHPPATPAVARPAPKAEPPPVVREPIIRKEISGDQATNTASAPSVPPKAAVQAKAPEARTAVSQITVWQRFWPWIAPGALMLLTLGVWLGTRLRVRTRPQLLPEHFGLDRGPYVVIAPSSSTGSGIETPPAFQVVQADDSARTASETLQPRRRLATDQEAARKSLLQWIKAEFVRHLVRDRAELLEGQSEALKQANDAGRRLASLEERLEKQNKAYDQRIEELTRELGLAREENRELIRSRIAQVKADMEAARAKLLGQSR